MRRDFTYVDDLVETIHALMDVVPHHPAIPVKGDSLSPVAPFRVVNIGNGEPIPLIEFIHVLEGATGLNPRLQMLPMQPGDVEATWADTGLLQRLIGPCRRTPVAVGLRRYVDWFASYHAVARPILQDRRVLEHPL